MMSRTQRALMAPLLLMVDFLLRCPGLERFLSLVSKGTKGSGRQDVLSVILTASSKSSYVEKLIMANPSITSSSYKGSTDLVPLLLLFLVGFKGF